MWRRDFAYFRISVEKPVPTRIRHPPHFQKQSVKFRTRTSLPISGPYPYSNPTVYVTFPIPYSATGSERVRIRAQVHPQVPSQLTS